MLLGQIAQRHTARCSTTALFMGIVFFFPLQAALCNGCRDAARCKQRAVLWMLAGGQRTTDCPSLPPEIPPSLARSMELELLPVCTHVTVCLYDGDAIPAVRKNSVFSPNLLRLTGE